MKVTMKSIAQIVGVSVNTVSLALRGMPGIKEETREKIFRTAKELGYVAAPVTPEVRNICLVSKAERLRDSYFFMSFYQLILEKVKEYGYNILVYHSANIQSAQQITQSLKANFVSGIILLGDLEEAVVKMTASCGLPLVSIGARYHTTEVCTFIEDNQEGAYQAVAYLHEHGYRKIGFVGDPLHSTAFMERYQGYLGSLYRFGMPIDTRLHMHDIDNELRYDFRVMADKLQRMEELPEAFVCANDNLAVTAVKALNQLGIRTPEDMGLIGFDANTTGKMCTPSITSIDVCCEVQAAESVHRLMEAIDKGDVDSMSRERRLLQVRLVEGDSVVDRNKETA
ncbi:MAG: LacI family DNA-binding transcriptional regulator [Lachnospiraceae bacterium]